MKTRIHTDGMDTLDELVQDGWIQLRGSGVTVMHMHKKYS